MQTIVFTKSTKKDFIKETVLSIEDASIKINLRNRQPIVGRIVFIKDGDDLLRKDMVRFVYEYKSEKFDLNHHEMHTKIFNITEFEVITIYEKETI